MHAGQKKGNGKVFEETNSKQLGKQISTFQLFEFLIFLFKGHLLLSTCRLLTKKVNDCLEEYYRYILYVIN
jgi:hypothetical protein